MSEKQQGDHCDCSEETRWGEEQNMMSESQQEMGGQILKGFINACKCAMYLGSLELLYPHNELTLLSLYKNILSLCYGFWPKVYFV